MHMRRSKLFKNIWLLAQALVYVCICSNILQSTFSPIYRFHVLNVSWHGKLQLKYFDWVTTTIFVSKSIKQLLLIHKSTHMFEMHLMNWKDETDNNNCV